MTRPRFFCDEHVHAGLVPALLRREPTLDLLQVGQPGASPRGTPDPDLLIAAESMARILLTQDRKTMPGHLTDHYDAGLHTHGVILMRDGFPWLTYINEILLIWGASSADEWIDIHPVTAKWQS